MEHEYLYLKSPMIIVPILNRTAAMELYNMAVIEHKLVILTGAIPRRWSN